MSSIRNFEIKPEHELRLLIQEGTSLLVSLNKGDCECFGTELAEDYPYEFHGTTSIGLFSWKGCEVSIQVLTSGSKTPYVDTVQAHAKARAYLRVHAALEEERAFNAKIGRQGPNVCVCGGGGVGKTTLLRVLSAYAVRRTHHTITVDMDTHKGAFGVCGVVGVCRQCRQCPPQTTPGGEAVLSHAARELFSESDRDVIMSSGDLLMFLENEKTLNKIKEIIDKLFKKDPKACDGGVFIDVCRCEADAESIERLKRVVSIFAVTTLIVIDDGFLHKRLEDVFSERKDINIILLPKLDGVYSRNAEELKKYKDKRLKDYFYGNYYQQRLIPKTFNDISKLTFCEVNRIRINPNFIPQGETVDVDPFEYTALPTTEIERKVKKGQIYAVFTAKSIDELKTLPVEGFVSIKDVSKEDDIVSVTCTIPREFREVSGDDSMKTFLVKTDTLWLDEVNV